jgi:hypothetical protein
MDSDLSNLDGELGKIYSDAIRGAGDPESLRSEQRIWISEIRNKCKNTDCLKIAYTGRITELTGESEPEPLSDKEMEQWESHSGQMNSDVREDRIQEAVVGTDATDSASADPQRAAAPQTRQEPGALATAAPPEVSVPSDAAKSPVARTSVDNLLENPKQLLKLVLVAILGSLVILAILGASDRVVVFYNYTDAWWSVSPLVFLLGSAVVANFLAPPGSTEFASTDTEKAALAVGIFGAVVGVAFTIVNAVRYNRSILIGLPIGLGKIMISGLMLVTFVGSFRAMFDSKRSTRQVLGFALVVMLVGFLWKMLVNGDRVYQRKGWSK